MNTEQASTQTIEDTTEDAHQGEHTAAEHSDVEHQHPSDWQYIRIAIILGVLTALEVFTYFDSVLHLSNTLLYIFLTFIMVLKFVYVVSWFMHLKFDSQTFRRVFTVSVCLALVVYLSMLTSFAIWG